MQENNSAKELEQENSLYLKDNVEDILCHLYAKLLTHKPPDPVLFKINLQNLGTNVN